MGEVFCYYEKLIRHWSKRITSLCGLWKDWCNRSFGFEQETSKQSVVNSFTKVRQIHVHKCNKTHMKGIQQYDEPERAAASAFANVPVY